MHLEIYRTLWGVNSGYTEAAEESRAAGFDGIETPVPEDKAAAQELNSALQANGLKLIADLCTAGEFSQPDRRATVDDHITDLVRQLETSLTLQPAFINCMGGCDSWDDALSLEFFERCLEIEQHYQVTISQEIHRGRSLFNPWVTRRMVTALPELKLTCDFSHWCVVCERLLDIEDDALELIAGQAHHIHSRVGYPEGPQVPHPAAPEYADALAAHQRWWELIWEAQRRKGYERTTMCPEYGVDGYLHELPFTRAPVVDQWEVQQWVARTEQEHFAAWEKRSKT
jgi:hypothetical protein